MRIHPSPARRSAPSIPPSRPHLSLVVTVPVLVLMILLTGGDERPGDSDVAFTRSADAAERALERRPVERGPSTGRLEVIRAADSDAPEQSPGDSDGPPEPPPEDTETTPETPTEPNPGNSDGPPEPPGSGSAPPTEQPDEPETPGSDTPEQTPEDAGPETPPEQNPGNGDGPDTPPTEQPAEPETPDSDTPEQTPEDAGPETPPEQSPGNSDGPPERDPDRNGPPEQGADPDTTSGGRGPRERGPAIDGQPLEQPPAPPAPDGPRPSPTDGEGRDGGEGTSGSRDPDGGAGTPSLTGPSGSAPLTGRSSSLGEGSALREGAVQNVAPGLTAERDDPAGATPPRESASVWDHLAALPASSAPNSTADADPSPRTAADDDVVARGGSESSPERDTSGEPDSTADDVLGGSAAGPDTDQGDGSSERLLAGRAFAPPEDAEGVAVWLLALSLLAFVVLTGAVVVQRGRLTGSVAGLVPVGRSSTPRTTRSRPDSLRSRFSPGSAGTVSPPRAGPASTALLRPAPAEPAPPLAPDTPPSPPRGAVAGWTARIAEETQVDPTTLQAAAAAVERRQTLTRELNRATAAEARSESRLVSVSLCLLPAGAGVALLALGDMTTLPALLLSGVVIVLAAALTFRGFRWVRRLPDTQRRVPGGSAGSLDDADRLDGSLATVDEAVLYAAAGRGGLEALRLAAPDDPTHPVRKAITQPGAVQAPVTETERALVRLTMTLRRTSNSADAATLLDWASERLHSTHRADLRERVLLVRVRAVGPFLLCYLPASALLLAPLVL